MIYLSVALAGIWHFCSNTIAGSAGLFNISNSQVAVDLISDFGFPWHVHGGFTTYSETNPPAERKKNARRREKYCGKQR